MLVQFPISHTMSPSAALGRASQHSVTLVLPARKRAPKRQMKVEGKMDERVMKEK